MRCSRGAPNTPPVLMASPSPAGAMGLLAVGCEKAQPLRPGLQSLLLGVTPVTHTRVPPR